MTTEHHVPLPVAELTGRFAGPGQVTWIGVRIERRGEVRAVDSAEITLTGVAGDHRSSPGKRTVTLIQHEHLTVIAALCGLADLDPALVRRNIAVAGINLLGLRNRTFRVGGAELRGTGLCAPCSRMETALGHGGFTAMRGHGGITAEVLSPGPVALGDRMVPSEG